MNKNKIFAYIVLVLNTIAAWCCWWILAGSILGRMRHVWLFPILAFSAWGIFFTLAVIFVRERKLIFSSLLAGVLAYPIFFGTSFSILGAILAILILIFTEGRTKKEVERGIKIDFYHLVSHTLKFFVTAACLAIAVIYYFSITDRPSVAVVESKSLEAEMDWGLKAAGVVLSDEKKKLVEDIRNDVSVDDFLSKNFVEPEIEEGMGAVNSLFPGSAGDATRIIGDAAAVQIREEMLAKSKRDLAKQLGVDVVGERPMKDVLMSYIDKSQRSFFEYSGSDKFYIPLVLALGLFLTARVLGTAVDIFLGLLILGIVKLLLTLGVVSVRQEQREVGVIEYSV